MDLLQSAKELLEANTRTAEKDGRRYRFTVPSPIVYPFQWFWDSCFHAIVWTHFDIERAKDELRWLFAFQSPNGFIPHVIFWDKSRVRRLPFHWHYLESKGFWNFLPFAVKPQTTYHIQPPVLAQAVERIHYAGGGNHF